MIWRFLQTGLALAVLTACAHTHASSAGLTGTEVGMPPVSFTLPVLGGGHDALAAHRGQVVLLDLWASWCPPCREELPELSQLAKSDPKLVVLAANQGETSDVVSAVAHRLHLQIPILLDHGQEYGAAYATIGLPTAVILAPSGKIAAVETGSHTAPEWRAIIAKALAR